ncbi:hypothetical protein [Candidatus Chlorohelix sp.]
MKKTVAADTRHYPEAEFGEAWQPSKLYTTAFTHSNWLQVWEILRKEGRE